MSAPPERRGLARSPAAPNQVRLRWWEGGEFRESTGRILDISRGGASLVVDDPPHVVPVWVRLEEPTPTDWFEVRVIRLTAGHLVGLGFPEPCPEDLQAVIIRR